MSTRLDPGAEEDDVAGEDLVLEGGAKHPVVALHRPLDLRERERERERAGGREGERERTRERERDGERRREGGREGERRGER